MRILVKTNNDTLYFLKNKTMGSHCGYYYAFLFRDIFRKLGIESYFLTEENIEGESVNTFKDDDILFCWGLESIILDPEFSKKVLDSFKGKKILYITAMSPNPLIEKFDYIFSTEMEFYTDFYKEKYPNIISQTIPLASPFFEIIDKEELPDNISEKYKVIYTGVLTDRYIPSLNQVAETLPDVQVIVGGIYAKTGEKGCRRFTEKEVKKLFLPSIIKMSPLVNFAYCSQFKWFRKVDLGISFYPSPWVKSKPINSKIIDYMVCGLPCLLEEPSPSVERVKELNAGSSFPWNNIDKLVECIKQEQILKRDKSLIQKQARKIFDPIKIGKQILKEVL